MGPDCGTAIINGVGLCFANEVRSEILELSALLVQAAKKLVSKSINMVMGFHSGTGGRDLSAEIGGLMMLDGLDTLMVDEQTKAILLISKPPAPEVTEKILKISCFN